MDIEILKIASDTKNHKVLDKCTHKAKQKNSMCGDEMDVSVKIVKDQILDFGNSGTSVRLLAGLLIAQNFNSELTGDRSLMKRPMFRIVNPLREMNAKISCTQGGTLPIKIRGGEKNKAIQQL